MNGIEVGTNLIQGLYSNKLYWIATQHPSKGRRVVVASGEVPHNAEDSHKHIGGQLELIANGKVFSGGWGEVRPTSTNGTVNWPAGGLLTPVSEKAYRWSVSEANRIQEMWF